MISNQAYLKDHAHGVGLKEGLETITMCLLSRKLFQGYDREKR